MLICRLIGFGIGLLVGSSVGYHLSKVWNVPEEEQWKYVLGGALIGGAIGAACGYCVRYALASAGSAGLALWSGGKSVGVVAAEFAKQNGMKVLEMTLKGRLLNLLQKRARVLLGSQKAWEFMKPLWQAASEQFAKFATGTVHVFLNASDINFESVWLQIEYWILREFGIEMVIHYVNTK